MKVHKGFCGECKVEFMSHYKHYSDRAICPLCDYMMRLLPKK